MATAVPPADSMPSTTVSSFDRVRPTTATVAPSSASASATPWPAPCPAPVTIAILRASGPVIGLLVRTSAPPGLYASGQRASAAPSSVPVAVTASGCTFVLIHGGGSSSAFWDLLVPLLDAPALAIDLPGRAGKPADPMTLTVDECVASIADDVDDAELGDVVLVAHSSGGLFVPGVAAALAPRACVTSCCRRVAFPPRVDWVSKP